MRTPAGHDKYNCMCDVCVPAAIRRMGRNRCGTCRANRAEIARLRAVLEEIEAMTKQEHTMGVGVAAHTVAHAALHHGYRGR